MEKFNKKYEQFEDYLNGTLSKEEQKKVEDLLQEDKDFAGDLENFKLLIDGIKYSGRNNLREKVLEWDEEIADIEERDSGKVRKLKWYYLAASIAFFLIVSSVIIFTMETGNDELYAEYYSPYDYISKATRGDETDDIQISHWYDQAQYEKTITAISDISADNQTPEMKLALGNCYMQLSKYEEAIRIIKEVSDENLGNKIAADWYLSLCYLANEQPELAVAILKNISEIRSSYAARAQNLLNDLE